MKKKTNNNKNTCSFLHDFFSQGINLTGGRSRRPKRETGGSCGDGKGAAGGAGAADAADGAGAAGAAGGAGVKDLDSSDGADIIGVKKGFRRSTDTVQGFPARRRTKVFAPLSSTLKGPV